MFKCPLTGQLCFNEKTQEVPFTINGQPSKTHICNICATQIVIQQNIWQNFLRTTFVILGIDKLIAADEMKQVISTIKNKQELDTFIEEVKARNAQSPCPKCNMDIHSLMSSGRIGCANCYSHFADFIRTLVMKVQNKATTHIGKKPKDTSGGNMEILKQELEMAIKEEKYEEAAVLRDKIKGIQL